MNTEKPVRMFTISTCSHCKAAKRFMKECGVTFEFTDVDLLSGDEKKEIIKEIEKHNPRRSYPTILIGDAVIVGFKENEIRSALDIDTAGAESASGEAPKPENPDAARLYEALKKSQEAKGYYFNKNLGRTFELLEALLVNRERYGYIACPCRLAAGDREWDRDIFCPCVYREPDVAEYGSCYCNLYVSKEWNEGTAPRRYVPERRPPEKFRREA